MLLCVVQNNISNIFLPIDVFLFVKAILVSLFALKNDRCQLLEEVDFVESKI